MSMIGARMMEKDFLKGFRKRMQFVARYSVLCGNSIDRVVKWRSFGINTRDEQINMLFSVLLYIMEYSFPKRQSKNICSIFLKNWR